MGRMCGTPVKDDKGIQNLREIILLRPSLRWEVHIGLIEMKYQDVKWIHVAEMASCFGLLYTGERIFG
jgi:hypothetical protein